ncbi:MAG: PIN domain protein [Candidatus Hydrogenedentes bacterium]|nr:PIN domain protein [Candidatus Hydrogenedentota bacterium]
MVLRSRETHEILRVYCDTSVFGGCFDKGFELDSLRVIRMARNSEITIVTSQPVLDEIADGPPHVLELVNSLPKSSIEFHALTKECISLQREYLRDGVLGARWAIDALHVAAATVARADAIVSWNFRHIVRIDKIKAFNEVNMKLGYPQLIIVSPKQVQEYDDEN